MRRATDKSQGIFGVSVRDIAVLSPGLMGGFPQRDQGERHVDVLRQDPPEGLTHWAQATGLEWNVRISGARNRSIVEKVAAVFDSYWEEADFEPYDRAPFIERAWLGPHIQPYVGDTERFVRVFDYFGIRSILCRLTCMAR